MDGLYGKESGLNVSSVNPEGGGIAFHSRSGRYPSSSGATRVSPSGSMEGGNCRLEVLRTSEKYASASSGLLS